MIIDPHIHSTYSGDSTASVQDIVKYSRKIGLDAIAIADHNSLKGSQEAIKEFGNMEDLVIIPAMEVSSSKGHIVAMGISEEIPKGLSPEETVELIRVQGGIAIAAHPFVSYREGLFTNVNFVDVDAMETLNSRYIFGYSNWRARNLAKEKNIPRSVPVMPIFWEPLVDVLLNWKQISPWTTSFKASSLEKPMYLEIELPSH